MPNSAEFLDLVDKSIRDGHLRASDNVCQHEQINRKKKRNLHRWRSDREIGFYLDFRSATQDCCLGSSFLQLEQTKEKRKKNKKQNNKFHCILSKKIIIILCGYQKDEKNLKTIKDRGKQQR